MRESSNGEKAQTSKQSAGKSAGTFIEFQIPVITGQYAAAPRKQPALPCGGYLDELAAAAERYVRDWFNGPAYQLLGIQTYVSGRYFTAYVYRRHRPGSDS